MNPKSMCLAAVCTFASTLAAFADAIPDGEYKGPGDGSMVTMTVTGNTVKLVTVGTVSSCSGGGEGPISEVSEGSWRITLQNYGQCIVDVSKTTNGYSLNPQFDGDCMSFSGQSCSFSADVTS